MMISLRSKLLGVLTLVVVAPGCSGGTAMPTEAIECCMLRELATNCSRNASSSLLQATQQWREVGNSGNDDACIRMVDDQTLGCTGGGTTYNETDALVDCS